MSNKGDFASLVREARTSARPALLTDAIPYARLLGVQAHQTAQGLRFLMPASPGNVGNPTLPALHGGAIGGCMETAAALHLLMTMDTLKVPKIVDFSIDYVRAGKLKDTWVSCDVVRQGRRLVNIGISAWQTREEEPIARARAHFLLGD
ncbi:PaaI family thioesterase [Simiduia sp. 21SJ11W-1]|uniref:PaaI family thioesterase n=1 Tax=Simiduia sp. 21SJ11W-1 TaxID=2909669 RepID=UPI00209D0244|nr:PaaI family thioesterase [Simiduia sp. 21SJ11W-1]UTA46461.1 PaaI family thioesterase [Simiduia sp. 21SJ11W-1]